jgi:hypothetical protein
MFQQQAGPCGERLSIINPNARQTRFSGLSRRKPDRVAVLELMPVRGWRPVEGGARERRPWAVRPAASPAQAAIKAKTSQIPALKALPFETVWDRFARHRRKMLVWVPKAVNYGGHWCLLTSPSPFRKSAALRRYHAAVVRYGAHRRRRGGSTRLAAQRQVAGVCRGQRLAPAASTGIWVTIASFGTEA